MDKKESLLKQRDEAKKEAAQYENQVKILPTSSFAAACCW